MTTENNDLLRKLYQRLQDLKTENNQLKKKLSGEPVAIIGIGCELASGIKSMPQFVDQLKAGVNWVKFLPDERESFQSEAKSHWKSSMIDNVELFDPSFFEISELEAASMDPQQRILLETAYRTLEDTCYPINELRGENVGVFIGSGSDDYQNLASKKMKGAVHALNVTGNARPIAAGRIAYTFNFSGPVLQLDTACSSSMIAIHLACNSIRQGDSAMALAGGVALNLTKEGYVARDAIGKLSNSGEAQPFGEHADGFVRGEGCGLVMLKRLSEALNDGDHIHGVIYASSSNHNGRTNGMVAPNGEAQRNLLRNAIAKAGISKEEIDFLEPHGTASRIGDAIELQAISDIYGGKDRDSPLRVGSTKSRLGHLEAAAGVVSAIKVCGMLGSQVMTGDKKVPEKNSLLDWDDLGIELINKNTPWLKEPRITRYGAVSAFGVNGSNAHLIIGDPPEIYYSQDDLMSSPPLIFCISGKTKTSFLNNVSNLCHMIQNGLDLDKASIQSCVSREHFTYRYAFNINSLSNKQILQKLRALREHSLSESLNHDICFNFVGDGWTTDTLIKVSETNPVFYDQLVRTFTQLAGRDVTIEWFQSPEASLYQDFVSIIGEYVMAHTWMEIGIRPSHLVVSGHGIISAVAIANKISISALLENLSQSSQSRITVKLAKGDFELYKFQDDGEEEILFETITEVLEFSRCDHRLNNPFKPLQGIALGQTLYCQVYSTEVLTIPPDIPVEKNGPDEYFFETVAYLYNRGIDIDFSKLYRGSRKTFYSTLPHYDFDKLALWDSYNYE